jgi:hypothetical protein
MATHDGLTTSNKQPSIFFLGEAAMSLFGEGRPFQGIEDVFRGPEQLGEAIADGLIIGALVLVDFLLLAAGRLVPLPDRFSIRIQKRYSFPERQRN